VIEKKTVFILGAGASMPYGFPSGTALLNRIIQILKGDKGNSFMEELGYSSESIHEFSQALTYSGRTSIDLFLEYRPEFVEIGKAAIATALIPAEKEQNLFPDAKDDNWYQYLYGCLSTDFDKFDSNKVGFVTFNYDRSLEHYLFTAMKNGYGKSDQECADKLSKIPFVHVHGSLGCLPWQGESNRPYEPEVTEETVRHSADRIKIICESIDQDEQFHQAHTLLKEAEQVCILGFGYNKVNLDRLQLLTNVPDSVKIKGSSYGLTDLEKEGIKKNMNSRIELGLHVHKALGYLRNHFSLM
jgi:hypothetical protein